MNTEKYTQKTNDAIENAQKMAIKNNHQQIESEHLHYGLLVVEDSLILKVLAYLEVDIRSYTAKLEQHIMELPSVEGNDVKLYTSRGFNKVLIHAEDIAKSFTDEYISPEHVFLGLFEEKRTFNAELMQNFNVTKEKVLNVIKIIREDGRASGQNPGSGAPEGVYRWLTLYRTLLPPVSRLEMWNFPA